MVNIANSFGSGPIAVSEILELRVYPIKSCRGIVVNSSYLTKQGLDLDRRWMFAEAEKKNFITIREISKMTLIDTAFLPATQKAGEQLQISIQGTNESVSIPARPTVEWLESNTTLSPCSIWGTETDGFVYGESVNKIFTDFFERPVALIYKGPAKRITGGNGHPSLLGRESTVNFPDVMPLQIANEASLRELNTRLKSKGVEEITIERFRPNVIIKGAYEGGDELLPRAWSEDSWKTVRIINKQTSGLSYYISANSLDIDVQARCARCQVPNVNPDTAEKHKHEPWDTLVSYRRVDEGIKFKPCFGMLSVPRNEGEIAVGMRFEVTLETNDHKYAKGF